MIKRNHYIKCRVCKNIIIDNSLALAKLDNPCSECGNRGTVREIWPRVDVLNIIDDTNLSSLDIQNAGPLKLVLYCSIFDFLFEDFLVELLYKIGTPVELIDFIINKNSDSLGRLSLFRQISGEKLEDVLGNNQFSNFAKEFKVLREKRNKLVHKTFLVEFKDLVSCFEVVEKDILPVFVLLNNKYISNLGSIKLPSVI